jgi:serine phosphatase RsbU (regulator of sigma subunit)
VQLNLSFSPSSFEVAILIAALIAIIALLWLYRFFPVHLIYRSKVGFESMLDAVNEPLAVISNNHTVRRVNKAYTDMTGRSYKTCINAKCYKLLRNLASPCPDCRLGEALERSETMEIDVSPHPSGVGSVTITFSTYAMPIKGNGAEICVIEHIRDITALERLKSDLERRNKFLATLTGKLRAAQRSIKAELWVANQIQLGLLPPKPPQLDKMRIDMAYKPVADVGGDLYDFIQMEDGRVGVFIGDASGHGLASALIGTLSKMSLYNHSRSWLPTSDLLTRMNKDLKAHIHTSHYLTGFWCVFDFEHNKLTYSRAGHPAQIVLRKDGTMYTLSGNGIFLGITEDAAFDQKEFFFEQGDRFFWFTDGIYDVFKESEDGDNEKKEFLGYDKFAELVKLTVNLPFNAVISALKKSLSGFNPKDDFTIIIAEIGNAKES